MSEDSRINEVLTFWFGGVPTRKFGLRELASTVSRIPYWYGKLFWFLNDDETLANKYEGLVRCARSGELKEWESSTLGRLALILLLDQFPRNIYRNQPTAFVSDEAALQVAKKAIEAGDDRCVNSLARTFYYFPLMHQEESEMQSRSVELCRNNVLDSNCLNSCNVLGVYISSLRHRSIIRKFSRYPHRNRALGRISTPEEERFLKMPFSSF